MERVRHILLVLLLLSPNLLCVWRQNETAKKKKKVWTELWADGLKKVVGSPKESFVGKNLPEKLHRKEE